jgi:RHS repeat-associated protein
MSEAKTASGDEKLREYTCNNLGRVETVTDYPDFLSGSSDAIQRNYSYDAFDRTAAITYADEDGGEVQEAYTYAYDKNDQIIREGIKNLRPAESAEKTEETREYTYDDLDRLRESATNDALRDKQTTKTYTYDAVGNRLSEDDGSSETTYTYNSLNQLTASKQQEENTDGLETVADKVYTYDKNGNQTSEVDSVTGVQNTMAYDADNRLASYVSKQEGQTTLTQKNQYNGEGQRIRKTETKDGSTQQNNYYYQGSTVLYTTDGSSALTSLSLMGLGDNVIATTRGTGEQEKGYLYTKDTRGSVTNLLDDQGNATVSYGYDEFGETTVKSDEGFYNEIGYTGQIRDAKTGLYYYNARYYDPENGRFVTLDTYRGEKEQYP